MRNAVQLITYVDRLGGDIAGLEEVLDGPLAGLFGGVHLLPFFVPFDGADAGFDPDDHTTVDPRLGTWDDVARLADGRDLMVDVIVNHVSSRSPQFIDWLEKGERSTYDGMFLTLDTVFPGGGTADDLGRVYRPRPGVPATTYTVAGEDRSVWTTFTRDQIDIDVTHPASRAYLVSVLDRLAAASVDAVRLDAVGYAVKTPGTSCFMTDETFGFIDELTEWCTERALEVLVEVHSYYRRQLEIAARVDLVYDFALPPLILHALTTGEGDPLADWLAIRPTNAITVLDTHDGIGVVDVGADVDGSPGLLPPSAIHDLVERIHDNSGGTSRAATGAAASNVDLYQVNCTFYDALGRSDDAYLAARAIQLFTPGIPQIYYVGLFAGSNDMDLLARTGVGRDVNRHHYTRAEIDDALARPVVERLCDLIRLRNAHPAFAGAFAYVLEGSSLTMRWTSETGAAVLSVDLGVPGAIITTTDADGSMEVVWSTGLA